VVHDVQWVFAHVEGGVACFDLGMLEFGGGDVVARDNGGKAVGKFSKVGLWWSGTCRVVSEGAGFGDGVGIDGGAGGDVNVLGQD